MNASPSRQVFIPTSREHSALASPRDADSPLKVWRKNNTLALQSSSDHDVLQQLIRTVEKMRRRILGGAAVAGGWDWMYTDHKELDSTLSYAAGKWAYLSPSNPLVTTGLTDLTTGALVKACQGYWLCCKEVKPQSVISGVTKFNVPQFPHPGATGTPAGTPLKGDLDDPNVFWIYFGQVAC